MKHVPRSLDYASRVDGFETFVGDSAGQTSIQVLHPSGFDWWVLHQRDALTLAPFYIYRRLMSPLPPAVQVTVDGESIRIVETNRHYQALGRTRIRRTASLMIRPNVYESGLYIDAPGQVRMNVLSYLDDVVIDWLSREVNTAIERHPIETAA